jgi:hypothetical protein
LPNISWRGGYARRHEVGLAGCARYTLACFIHHCENVYRTGSSYSTGNIS